MVCHVDHGWRPDSGSEQDQLRELIAPWSTTDSPVCWRGERVSCDRTALGREGAAREARYASFAAVAADERPWALIMAHHQTDQCETVLLNALRGGGSWGLSSDAAGAFLAILVRR